MDEGSKGGKTPTSKEQGLFLLVLLSTRKRLGRSLSTEMRSGFVPGLSAPFNPMVIILLETRGHWQGSGFLLLLFSPPGSGHRSFEQSGPSRGGPISSSLGVVPTWGGATQLSTASFKGSSFKSADRAQLSVPANRYESGRES